MTRGLTPEVIAEAQERCAALSPLERDVLIYSAKGMRAREIGALMGRGHQNVEKIKTRIFATLEVETTVEATSDRGQAGRAAPSARSEAGRPRADPGRTVPRAAGRAGGRTVIVTLITGEAVDSASEEYRHFCEAQMVVDRPTLLERRAYLEEVERRRGKAEADRLRATMGEIWKARKAARER